MMKTEQLSAAIVDRWLEAVAEQRGSDLTSVRQVVALRRRHVRDGNRRRLFAALDQLLGAPGAAQERIPADVQSPDGGVRLTRLELRNWKVFETLDLPFPAFDASRPVVLIGGKNGYGKTSLLEGLLHGLFGRGAVLDLGMAEAGARVGAYRQRLQRAFNRRALSRGETKMSVRSEWQTPEGLLVVERVWFFDEKGGFSPEDEELTLWAGDDRTPLTSPDEVDSGAFLQEEVHRRLLSPSLAAFVFFDGEQVQRFAEVGFSDQVRTAVESATGLSTWRGAATDLRDYARDRGRTSGRADERDESAVKVARIVDEIERLRASLGELRRHRAGPEAARDALVTEIAGLEGGDYAGLHVLLERQQANRAEQTRARHDLAAASGAIAPMLLMHRLRAALKDRLDREAEAAGPLASLFQSDDALNLLLKTLAAKSALSNDVQAAVRDAWLDVRAKEEEAEARRHAYLAPPLLQSVRQGAARALDDAPLQAAMAHVQDLAQEADALTQQLAAQRRRDERLDVARRELQDVRHDLGMADAEIRLIEDRLAHLESERMALAPAEQASAPAEQAVAVGRALSLAEEIEAMVCAVLPQCFDAVGSVITEAYRELAHKDLVSEIELDAEGRVRLLDIHGADVRSFEASAGEAQVFAMALIGALGTLVGERFPVVIDTPLGRLDPDHRRRVLHYFTSRGRQTVLLSQPDEVGGVYLSMIADRVAASFRLEHISADGGPGGSTAMAGYFDEMAA